MRLSLLAVLVSISATISAEPARYVIDPEHLVVGFRVDHLGFADVVGFFGEVEGSYTFDEESGTLSDIDVNVNTSSVFSNDDGRDGHLRGRDFLDADRHETMSFRLVSVARLSEREFAIQGELDLLGVQQPLQLNATWNKSGDYPIGRNVYVMGVSATGTLLRSNFGMTYAVDNGWVGDEVEIFIEFEARRE